MDELNRPAMGHPETPTEAVEVLEILMRAYVPKNTSDAKFCLAALNVLRVDAARREAARQVMEGIEAGRAAHRAGKLREAMTSDSERIGWDEAEYNATKLLDSATFRKGIRDDGTVDGYSVETHYLPCKGIGDDADGFLRVLVDDNATDVETRVPHSALRASGWLKRAPSKSGE